MALVVDTIGKITLPTGETVHGVILAADSEAEVKALAHLWSERVALALEEQDGKEGQHPSDAGC